MDAQQNRPSLWLISDQPAPLPTIRKPRPRLSMVLSLITIALCAGTYLLVDPVAVWQPQILFTALLVAGFVAYAGSCAVRSDSVIDATNGIAGLALVFFGPLPALIVSCAADLGPILSGKRPTAWLSNVADSSVSLLVGYAILQLLGLNVPLTFDGPESYVALALVIVVTAPLSYAIGVGLVDVVGEGFSVGSTIRRDASNILFVSLIAEGAILLASIVVAFLYFEYDSVALFALVPLVLAPRLVIPHLWRTKPISELSRSEATIIYSEVLGDTLGLDSARLDVLRDAATQVGSEASIGDVSRFQDVMEIVLHWRERFDGDGGFPGVLSGEAIPIESRILRTAETWAGLTAHGTVAISPEQAIGELVARSGTELDPRVVAAAKHVVDDDLLPVPSSDQRKKGQAKYQHKEPSSESA